MSSTSQDEAGKESGRWTSSPDTSLSVIFGSEVTPIDHVPRIIDRTLEQREQATNSARSAFNSAIRDCVDIRGFRDASRAPFDQLKSPVSFEVLKGNDRLATGVLRVWSDLEDDLRRFVSGYLEARGVPVDGPDLRRRRFHSVWPRGEWRRIRDDMAGTEAGSRFCKEDLGLMLCYVSGNLANPNRVETTGIESSLFLKFINDLDDLPSDAPDWDGVDPFINAVVQLAEDKAIDRKLAHTQVLRLAAVEVGVEFVEELRYLDLTIAPLRPDLDLNPLFIPESLAVIENLRSSLVNYQPVRPQGVTRTKEQERARLRAEGESAILELAEEWAELMSRPAVQKDESPSQRALETASNSRGSVTPCSEQSGARSAASAQELDFISSELGQSRAESDLLRVENSRLAEESASLRSDMSTLNGQISELKNDLSQSREMQEYWRRTYVAESAGNAGEESDQAVQPSSVNDALTLAAKSFPDRIRLALNSKSAENTPFQKPQEVFDALAWLATEYHRLRSNPGGAPNFDMLIKAACPGWSYMSKQTEVTKEQFAEWYTTTLDGKSYELDAHIGRGTSFDPHQTIRIAFDWDDESKQVIVGYLGRHQRNRRS